MVILGNLPLMYQNSEYGKTIINLKDEDDYPIPEEFYDEKLECKNYDNFIKLINIIKFWSFNEIPEVLIRYINENLNSSNFEKEYEYLNQMAQHSLIRSLIITVLGTFKIENFTMFIKVLELVEIWKLYGQDIHAFYDYCLNNSKEVIEYMYEHEYNDDFRYLLKSTYSYGMVDSLDSSGFYFGITGTRTNDMVRFNSAVILSESNATGDVFRKLANEIKNTEGILKIQIFNEAGKLTFNSPNMIFITYINIVYCHSRNSITIKVNYINRKQICDSFEKLATTANKW